MRLYALAIAVLILLLLNLCFPAAMAVRASGFESKLSSQRLEEFLSDHPEDDSPHLDSSVELDLEYRPDKDGYFGKISYVEEYYLRTRDGVKSRQYQSIYESRLVKLDELRIKVLHSTGKTKTYRRHDLKWTTRTTRDAKVYILDARQSIALIPELKPGDRLRVITRYRLEGLTSIPSFTFGGRDQPILHSRIDLRLPPNQALIFNLRGSGQLRANLSQENGVPGQYSWELWNIPAAAHEQLAGGIRGDRLEWLGHVTGIGKSLSPTAFAAGPDWKSVGSAYYQRIATALDPTPELATLSQELTNGLDDPTGKTDAIYHYVQLHCRYLGLFNGLEGILPKPASVTHHDGFGDCKGLGTYLIALLRGAGIQAYPALLLTADEGVLDRTVPSLSQFNHYIVWAAVGKKGIWLDATVRSCRAGVVPPLDAGSPVLLLEPGKERLQQIPFESWRPGLDHVGARGSLSWRGELDLRVTDTMRDNSAAGVRAHLRNQGGHLNKNAYLKALFSTNLKLVANSISLENLKDNHAPLRVLLDCHSKAPLAHTTQRIFLPRKIANDSLLHLDLEERLSPIDLRQLETRDFQCRICLPTGLFLAQAESLEITGPGIRWTRGIAQRGDSLIISEHFGWDNVLIPADHADSLLNTLDRIRKAEDGFYELATK